MVERLDEVSAVVVEVTRGWMDCTGSTVSDRLSVVAEDMNDIDECMNFAGDVAVAVTSPVVFAGNVAVAVALPAVAGAASPANLAEAVAVDVTALTDTGMVTVGVADLADAGMAFPADPAGVVTVGVASLADAGMVRLNFSNDAFKFTFMVDSQIWSFPESEFIQNIHSNSSTNTCCTTVVYEAISWYWKHMGIIFIQESFTNKCDGHMHGSSAGLVGWATVYLIVITDVGTCAIHRSCLCHRSIYSTNGGKAVY